jgi:phospholipid/cholesterol/gamma-HCH transport system substrate-binding protein
VLSELGSDRGVLEQLLANTSRLSGALAERAPQISSAVHHLNLAAGAVGRQRAALTRAVRDLPGFLRQADTTFVNLRAAADDLDPLLVAARPVARRLGPFFAELRGVAAGAVPTLRDLDAVLRRHGAANDALDLVRSLPPLRARAVGGGAPSCGATPATDYGRAADDRYDQGALGEADCALRNSLPALSQLRAYTPELVGWFDDFAASGVLDANGGIGRIAGTFNTFTVSPSNGLPELLSPVDPATLFNGATIPIDHNARCPGSNERDPGDGSVPFTDGGAINCDPTQVPPGP